MKQLLLATTAAVALSAAAQAADMPVKAPPLAVAVYSWNGCYIGGNAGANQTRTRFAWDFGPAFPDTAAFIAGRGAGADATLRTTGFTGGGGIGCNVQQGRWVWGVEWDLQVHTGSTSRFVDLVPFGLPAGNTLSEEVKTRWLATVRGRAGFTLTEQVLVYGTGGVAFINAFFNDHTNYPAAVQDISLTATRAGWVWGGGVEYAFSSNWSGKVEYLHADFGNVSSVSQAFTLAGAPVANAFLTHNHRVTTDIVRVGLNYRFGGPVIARY
jgi:outer membrane immunogenic protein